MTHEFTLQSTPLKRSFSEERDYIFGEQKMLFFPWWICAGKKFLCEKLALQIALPMNDEIFTSSP